MAGTTRWKGSGRRTLFLFLETKTIGVKGKKGLVDIHTIILFKYLLTQRSKQHCENLKQINAWVKANCSPKIERKHRIQQYQHEKKMEQKRKYSEKKICSVKSIQPIVGDLVKMWVTLRVTV